MGYSLLVHEIPRGVLLGLGVLAYVWWHHSQKNFHFHAAPLVPNSPPRLIRTPLRHDPPSPQSACGRARAPRALAAAARA
jgi:hypothetical protein